MEKTIIFLAKKLADNEAENEELRRKLKNLEQSKLIEQIANLEKVIAEREESHLNLLQKVAELEQAAEEKPKKCGNAKPRTPEQLEVLRRGREKAAANRAAAKRAN